MSSKNQKDSKVKTILDKLGDRERFEVDMKNIIVRKKTRQIDKYYPDLGDEKFCEYSVMFLLKSDNSTFFDVRLLTREYTDKRLENKYTFFVTPFANSSYKQKQLDNSKYVAYLEKKDADYVAGVIEALYDIHCFEKDEERKKEVLKRYDNLINTIDNIC